MEHFHTCPSSIFRSVACLLHTPCTADDQQLCLQFFHNRFCTEKDSKYDNARSILYLMVQVKIVLHTQQLRVANIIRICRWRCEWQVLYKELGEHRSSEGSHTRIVLP